MKKIDELIWGVIGIVSLFVFSKTMDIKLGLYTFFGLIFFYIGFSIIRLFLHRRKISRSGILDIDKMSGIQFEHYLSHLLSKKGYKTKVTQSTGDFGADLILKGQDGRTIVVQAKRYSKNVGIKAVQEIVASTLHYNATEAWVITNSYYTEAAKKLANSNNVRLYNRDHLINWILKQNTKTDTAING